MQQFAHVPLRLGQRVVDHAVERIHLHARKQADRVGRVRQVQRAGCVAVKVIGVDELHNIAEHAAVVHVVAVHEGIRIGNIAGVVAVQEDGPGQRELAVDVLVHILHVGLADDDGVVDVGAVDGQPAQHIRVDGLELLQRGVGIRVPGGGLELQQVAVQERTAEHHGGVPQRVAAEQQHEQDQRRGEHADQTVPGARQIGCGVQRMCLLPAEVGLVGVSFGWG